MAQFLGFFWRRLLPGRLRRPANAGRTTPGDPAWRLENTFRLVNIALNVERL